MEDTKNATPVLDKKTTNTVEGTVKSFDVGKGFGFITQDGVTKEVFVHQEAIMGDGNRNLISGDRVSFEVTEGPKGPRANSVHKI